MKGLAWWLLGLVVLVVVLVLLFVSRSDYDTLQADFEALELQNSSLSAQLQQVQSDLSQLQADYNDVSQELEDIQEVYPPRHFNSYTELVEWRQSVGVITGYPSDYMYLGLLELQERALEDGYIVSVASFYDYGAEIWWLWCEAAAGDSVYSFYYDGLEIYYEREAVL